MKDLTADDILQADDLPREAVPVPEWGGRLWVRAMTGQERDEYEMALFQAQQAGTGLNMRARLVAMTAVNADGERLFTHETQVEKLGRKSGVALDRVFEVAQRMCATGPKALQAAAGNSAGASGDAPSSESPSPSAAGPGTSSGN